MDKENHVIIGTAGHVDHGKTCLIRALTGIDTDRLKEEKKRGITIELGFAYLDLPDGGRAGMIDVPGHEKFVKNMLAGAGGIDIAMLVIAADEGVMAQTLEHLDILSLLGMKYGLIALTKTDLVEPDFIELVVEEIMETVKGTFLENAPVVQVSAYTGAGIEDLKTKLTGLTKMVGQKDIKKAFRLPVDRVFSMKGFGTVVTGTLIEGAISLEQEAVIYPLGEKTKIRNIQVHSKQVQEAYAGQRVAINLSNLKREEVKRGDVLSPADGLQLSMMLDVRLTASSHTTRIMKNNSRVHVYHGSRELLGKVVLMDQQELNKGESAYAQLRLEEAIAAKKGDHFVLRFYSPLETLGGGIVLDAVPYKHKRFQKEVLEGFLIKETGNALQRLEQAVLENRGKFLRMAELSKQSYLATESLSHDLETLIHSGVLIRITRDVVIHKKEADELKHRASAILKDFHKANPLKEGMTKEELRSRLKITGQSDFMDGLIGYFADCNALLSEGQLLREVSFCLQAEQKECGLLAELKSYFLEASYSPLAFSVLAKQYEKEKQYKQVLSAMMKDGTVIRLDDQYGLHKESYEKAQKTFESLAQNGEPVTLGEYRDALGSSRKIAVALLEYFDKHGITVKASEGRKLKKVCK